MGRLQKVQKRGEGVVTRTRRDRKFIGSQGTYSRYIMPEMKNLRHETKEVEKRIRNMRKGNKVDIWNRKKRISKRKRIGRGQKYKITTTAVQVSIRVPKMKKPRRR
jgi:hypothetical protein